MKERGRGEGGSLRNKRSSKPLVGYKKSPGGWFCAVEEVYILYMPSSGGLLGLAETFAVAGASAE